MKKSYKITVEADENGFKVKRENKGFTFIELLGILEHTQQDLLRRQVEGIKPDEIKTSVEVERPSKLNKSTPLFDRLPLNQLIILLIFVIIVGIVFYINTL